MNILKNVIKIVIAVIIAAAVITGIIYAVRADRKPAIPEGIVGNTSGNINNRGKFCESDGYIYFANPYDGQKLYRMKLDESEPECLTKISAEYINVYGNDIYFYQTSGVGDEVFGLGSQYGVCHCDTIGKDGTSFIDKTVCNSLILYGPNLYYQHYNADEGLTLYSASTRKNSKKQISEKEVFVSCPVNGLFYCPDTENMYYMSAFNISTGQMTSAPVAVRAYNVTYDSGYLYFMNIDDDYKIYRISLAIGGIIEKIVDEKVDIFNVHGSNLFYQKSSEDSPQLIHLNLDSGVETIVAEGNYTNINCTSNNTYFYEHGNESIVYKAPTSGGIATTLKLN